MAGYKTLEVIRHDEDTSCRIPVEVHIEKQQRVREDESTTRPFIKVKLVVGNRTVFCDVKQAKSLARMIIEAVPDAESALEKLSSYIPEPFGNLSVTDGDNISEGNGGVGGKRRRRVRSRKGGYSHEEDY